MAVIIADSGSTKCEWCIISSRKKQVFFTQGMSPYFLDAAGIEQIIRNELLPYLKNKQIDRVHYYGTGCKNPANARIFKTVLRRIFRASEIYVSHDLMGAARALCGATKGIACILGTGSNSCYFDGKRIVRNSPGLGYVLGDEGSGSYLGKKVLQYYLYNIFEKELKDQFEEKYRIGSAEIVETVYKKPLPNRYLASFTPFLSQNRGHYMIENIIEDGLNDFFFHHVSRYRESAMCPVHFTGSIAYHFRDVIAYLCNTYDVKLGTVIPTPMEGLIAYHRGHHIV